MDEKVTRFYLSDKSKLNRENIDIRLIDLSNLAIKLTTVDFGHHKDSGLRTAERQKELYDMGRSKADGYEIKSHHQTGHALDFYAYVDNKVSWEKEHLSMVATAFLQAAIFLGYKVTWGGLWENFKDYPHIQLLD